MEITKAIIPAAGLGTRFLPYTKAIPKEMLPLLDRPALQWIVEEGVASDIKNFLIITSKGKESLADHFDGSHELELILKERGKESFLSSLSSINRNAQFSYIRQQDPLGLGHAVSLARHAIGKEYFGVFLPDDIIIGRQPGLAQLIRIARQEKGSVIAVQEVPADCVSSYGIVAVKKQITPHLYQASHLVEKPAKKDAPSNLAIIGRYVLSHKVFNSLDEITPYAVGEIQLTDAISHMMKNNEKVFAYKVQGTRYDIGNPLGWLKATIGISLQDEFYGPHIKKYLKDLDTINSFIYDPTKHIEHTL
ncbi:UTP--glucose-1-phosphate uridylyltransferase [Candidatus Babeliales bacterium]|nr:UTP--glucose-1-phosphate uridylyltransferase [Candidatus Babeliales bacterium]